MSTASSSPAAAETLRYLETHNIQQSLERIVNQVLLKKPKDPFAFMSHQLSLQSRTPQVAFVLGGPGAGKGTQCANIVKEFGWVHLSAGDLLREERQKGTENGQLIENYIKEGKIVPVEITVNLLKNAMVEHQKTGAFQFLIDGFPRNEENLQGWIKLMGDSSIPENKGKVAAEVLFVLYFDCPENIMEQRLLKRGETSGRVDDNIESIRKRFNTYVKETQPIIDIYRQKDMVKHIIADRPVEQVYEEVKAIFSAISNPNQPKKEDTTSHVAFVLGGPGAGKGTQCANIVKEFGWVHLSAGDLLREERQKGTENGQLIENYIKEGKIVPVEITVRLLKNAMEEARKISGKTEFLIDGFPRNADNLEGWEKETKDANVNVEFVLYFNCPEDVMEQRLLKRGETSGRVDDNIESIKKRFHTYIDSTMPIINHFASKGKVREISAAQEEAAVFEQVKAVMKQYYDNKQ